MTLIKSILLGSAAGLVAVASAQAADLPTRKAAPVQYVQICNVGGITGWVLPGSDTCVKLSGYITAQFVAGNLNTQYNWASTGTYSAITGHVFPIGTSHSFPSLLIAPSDAQQNTTFFRHDTGWTTRSHFAFDFASNTAYGPLIGHMDFNFNSGNGLDNTGTQVNVNQGYLTWAGITAGKAQSFFSFTGGGDNWANFFSPDRKGFNEPELMAYTASFGGGFSATISFENPLSSTGGGTQMTGAASGNNQGPAGAGFNPGNITFGGSRWPDIVGALHYKAAWGEAQISGVVHDVNVHDTLFQNTALGFCGFNFAFACNASETKTGWAIDAGVSFNLPTWGPGDTFLITGAYSQNATWYSGLADGMWGENGQVNGNGQPMYLADAFFLPFSNTWSKPTAWSITAQLEHHFTPQFYVDLLGSYGGINWSNQGGCSGVAFLFTPAICPLYAVGGPLAPHARSWIIGADIGWMPVTNLNFDVELMYQSTHQDRPDGFFGTVYNLNGAGGAVFIPGDFHGNSSGFAGRFRITRYF